MQDQTFGQFLKKLLEVKGISMRRLAHIMNISSKTTVKRILDDESSLKSILNFADAFKRTVKLTASEQREMESAIAIHNIPLAVREARKNLRSLFLESRPEPKKVCRCVLKDGKECADNIYLEDVILSAIGEDERDIIQIYIENINSHEIIYALDKIIHRKSETKLHIHHYFKEVDDIEEMSLQILALLKLSTYLDYSPCLLSKEKLNSKRMVIFTKQGGEAHYINLYSPSSFGYLREKISNSAYLHFQKDYEILQKASNPMRQTVFCRPLENLPELLEIEQENDKKPCVAIMSSPCFMTIPFSIQKRLYEDSNYMGLGESNPSIQKMYRILKERCEFIDSMKVGKTYVYSGYGLRSFLKTGKTGDYFPFFRPLNKDEIQKTIDRLFNLKSHKVFLLKEEFVVRDLEPIIFEDRILEAYDPIWGYWTNFSRIVISEKRMMNIMRDFINEEIIKNCCYSEVESRRIITELTKSMLSSDFEAQLL